MIDPKFRNINRLFVLPMSFMSFHKPFFDQPIKNKQVAYEKRVKMSRNNYYRARHLLDYPDHQNYYKLNGIDLSRQRNTTISQQINFTGNLPRKLF